MPQNRIKQLLLGAVALIWGFIGWKIYTSYFPSEELVVEDNFSFSGPAAVSLVPDTFSLNLDYPDPFLKKTYFKRPKPVVTQKVKPSTRVKETKPVEKVEKPWPEIRFGGTVRQQAEGTTPVIMISIGGHDHLVQPGDTIQGMRVATVTSDSIRMERGKEFLIVSK